MLAPSSEKKKAAGTCVLAAFFGVLKMKTARKGMPSERSR
jgi:hypothetical protein